MQTHAHGPGPIDTKHDAKMDSKTAERIAEFRESEFFAHDVAYRQNLKEGSVELLSKDYTLLKPVTVDGLVCYILIPQALDDSNIKIVFRGTADGASIRRDLEPKAPGTHTFSKAKDGIVTAINHAIRSVCLVPSPHITAAVGNVDTAPHGISLSIYGHSLGGADAQRCCVALMDEINKALPNAGSTYVSAHDQCDNDIKNTNENTVNYFNRVKALSLRAYNSPGISNIDAIKANQLAIALKEKKLQLSCYYQHVAGDIVQQTGERNLFVDLNSDVVDMRLLKVHYIKAPEKAWDSWYNLFQVQTAIKNTIVAHTSFCHRPESPLSRFEYFDNSTVLQTKLIGKKLSKKSGFLSYAPTQLVQSIIYRVIVAPFTSTSTPQTEAPSDSYVFLSDSEINDINTMIGQNADKKRNPVDPLISEQPSGNSAAPGQHSSAPLVSPASTIERSPSPLSEPQSPVSGSAAEFKRSTTPDSKGYDSSSSVESPVSMTESPRSQPSSVSTPIANDAKIQLALKHANVVSADAARARLMASEANFNARKTQVYASQVQYALANIESQVIRAQAQATAVQAQAIDAQTRSDEVKAHALQVQAASERISKIARQQIDASHLREAKKRAAVAKFQADQAAKAEQEKSAAVIKEQNANDKKGETTDPHLDHMQIVVKPVLDQKYYPPEPNNPVKEESDYLAPVISKYKMRVMRGWKLFAACVVIGAAIAVGVAMIVGTWGMALIGMAAIGALGGAAIGNVVNLVRLACSDDFGKQKSESRSNSKKNESKKITANSTVKANSSTASIANALGAATLKTEGTEQDIRALDAKPLTQSTTQQPNAENPIVICPGLTEMSNACSFTR